MEVDDGEPRAPSRDLGKERRLTFPSQRLDPSRGSLLFKPRDCTENGCRVTFRLRPIHCHEKPGAYGIKKKHDYFNYRLGRLFSISSPLKMSSIRRCSHVKVISLLNDLLVSSFWKLIFRIGSVGFFYAVRTTNLSRQLGIAIHSKRMWVEKNHFPQDTMKPIRDRPKFVNTQWMFNFPRFCSPHRNESLTSVGSISKNNIWYGRLKKKYSTITNIGVKTGNLAMGVRPKL